MSVSIYLVPDSDLNSTQPPDDEIVLTAMALTADIDAHLAPVYAEGWGGHYQVIGLRRGMTVPAPSPRVWLCHLKTALGVPGALGYHTRDVSGNPVLYVDVVGSFMHNQPWSLVASHEVFEAMVNPDVDRGVLASYGAGQGFYYQECADPVEGQPGRFFRHLGKDYVFSNFVTPAYWRVGSPGPYDLNGYITEPLHPAGGGVQTVFVVSGAATISADGVHAVSDPDDPSIHAGHRT